MQTQSIETRIKKRANRALLKIAGRRFRFYSILGHVGRRSGRTYVTPVAAYPLGDGFVFALLDGPNVDWCRNVLAAGSCTLKTQGREYVLERPELIPVSAALGAYPPLWKLMIKARNIQQFLWVHHTNDD
jgi:deazaflavin-dependent oxidoreductase (nitroreductase family)